MHNAIHAFVGGSGHMAIVPFSAFDPVFWLHHANVDRLVAIWQAIYPDSWISTSQVNLAGTYTDEPGAPEDGNSSGFFLCMVSPKLKFATPHDKADIGFL